MNLNRQEGCPVTTGYYFGWEIDFSRSYKWKINSWDKLDIFGDYSIYDPSLNLTVEDINQIAVVITGK